MEYWNIGIWVLDTQSLIPFPQTHYSILPLFLYSNCEQSELLSLLRLFDQIQNARDLVRWLGL